LHSTVQRHHQKYRIVYHYTGILKRLTSGVPPSVFDLLTSSVKLGTSFSVMASTRSDNSAAANAAAAPPPPTPRTAHVQNTLTVLRESKDTVLDLHIRFYSGQDIADLVEAIDKNEHVSILRMEFDSNERSLASITPILSLVQNRPNLDTIVLSGSPLRMTELIIGAAALNTNLRTIIFYTRTILSVQVLCELLLKSKTLVAIYVTLSFVQESKDCRVEELEKAFRKNSSLEIVTLRDLDNEFLVSQVLRGLADHCKIRELNITDGGFTSWIAMNAIRYFAERSSTVKKVSFL
jgi:hypothetical protein